LTNAKEIGNYFVLSTRCPKNIRIKPCHPHKDRCTLVEEFGQFLYQIKILPRIKSNNKEPLCQSHVPKLNLAIVRVYKIQPCHCAGKQYSTLPLSGFKDKTKPLPLYWDYIILLPNLQTKPATVVVSNNYTITIDTCK
jgi:hypothetical protein